MDPMTQLTLATAAFVVTHYISSTPLRPALVKTLGENAYLVRAPRFDSLAAASIVVRWRDGRTTATNLG